MKNEIKLEDAVAALKYIRATLNSADGSTFEETFEDIARKVSATLNPVVEPTALELKVSEVADFIMSDFQLAFAPVQTITQRMNDEGLLTTSGKEWSKSNTAKIIVAAREEIVKRMSVEQAESPDEDAVEADEVEEVEIPEPEAIIETTVTPPEEPAVSPTQVESEGIHLDIDDLAILDDIAT